MSVPVLQQGHFLNIVAGATSGFGTAGYSKSGNSFFSFYLIQFDLLAKLGGLSLNIGGEIRGYYPNEPPIISAYLGTSFSISKLKDFVTNR